MSKIVLACFLFLYSQASSAVICGSQSKIGSIVHFDKPQCSAIKIDAHRYLTAAHCFNSLARNTETHFDLENAPKVNLKKINGKTQYTRITKISLHPSVRKVVQQKDDPDFVAQKTSDFADLAIIEIKDKNDVPIADLSFAVPSSEVKMVGFGPRFYGDDTQTQNALSTTIEKKLNIIYI